MYMPRNCLCFCLCFSLYIKINPNDFFWVEPTLSLTASFNRNWLVTGEWLFFRAAVKAAPVSWIPGVCSHFNVEAEKQATSQRESSSACQPSTCFFLFSTERTDNGTLISEEDVHSGRSCAKFARLFNASSTVLTYRDH